MWALALEDITQATMQRHHPRRQRLPIIHRALGRATVGLAVITTQLDHGTSGTLATGLTGRTLAQFGLARVTTATAIIADTGAGNALGRQSRAIKPEIENIPDRLERSVQIYRLSDIAVGREPVGPQNLFPHPR